MKFIGESTAPRPRKERLRTFESAKGLTWPLILLPPSTRAGTESRDEDTPRWTVGSVSRARGWKNLPLPV